MPALASDSRIADAPSSTAGSSLNPPPNFPMGVLAPATMTERLTTMLLPVGGPVILRGPPLGPVDSRPASGEGVADGHARSDRRLDRGPAPAPPQLLYAVGRRGP